MLALLVLSLLGSCYGQTCRCLTTSGVNVRATACGTVIGSANLGNCFWSTSVVNTCTLSGSSYNYEKLDYYGSDGWIANNYLSTGTSQDCDGGCTNLHIVTRSEWGARAPTGITYFSSTPRAYVVHHSDGSSCTTQSSCMSVVRGIQNWHMDGNGWSDIGYNFLIGEDGNAYEGRGWDRVGAHSPAANSFAIGTCVMGTFMSSQPNAAAKLALNRLIQCGIDMNEVTSNYQVGGHRDCTSTTCPGDALYSYVQGIDNYADPCP